MAVTPGHAIAALTGCGPLSRTCGCARSGPPGRLALTLPCGTNAGTTSVLGVISSRFPEDVLRRFELERRVVDVEVGRQAGPEVVEDVTGPRVGTEHDVG